jgi:hypothetical protein
MRSALLFFVVLSAALPLGCAQEVKYVPVELKREIPDAPPECDGEMAAALPAVPEIPKEPPATVKSVNAHWAKHWLRAQSFYRGARGKYAVCSRYTKALKPQK